ncbi:DUF2017 family protein [Arsenicicoccus sp. oral taxon 190]|uniref:DUF2017 family protein n=1 Tax=Arsenicicoccus sp. oral taxon 190 TaxID=1658671 RepID=UPI00067A0865|nr:DUF2017 family protein [Arsenicicoccus sp. oral taxon 190]AKT51484.1 hypothetical protein ADJ73_09415 [Arsenicicoccus sp. oral taxon 190]
MAQAFRRHGDAVVGHLDEDERDLVASLLTQVAGLIRGMGPEMPEVTGDPLADAMAGLGQAPRQQVDPAVRRLFPDARRDEGEQAQAEGAEFRRLTEMGLRQRKVATLEAAAGLLQHATDPQVVTLTTTQAGQLTVALTDVRLVLGERLGLRTDEDADALEDLVEAYGEDHPTVQTAALYDFLTWLQETLASTLVR